MVPLCGYLCLFILAVKHVVLLGEHLRHYLAELRLIYFKCLIPLLCLVSRHHHGISLASDTP